MREPLTLSIEEDICKDFKKKCIDKGVSYSEIVEELMQEFTKRK